MSEHDVSVQPRYERFPATIKGAFVVHGEDSNPHQVALLEARVVSLGSVPGLAIPMPEAVVNVPPREDMFVPFEFSITELESGWFELECDITVDGAPRTVTGAKRFLVNWPRSTTRRGPVSVKGDLGTGKDKTNVQQVECGTDRTTLRYAAETRTDVRLLADGQRLPQISESFREGQGVVECYPLLRSHSVLRIEVGRGEGRDFTLP